MLTLSIKTVIVAAIAICYFEVTHSYRILCPFPTVSQSHFIVLEPLLIALAEKGHNVTVIGPHPPRHPVQNYRHIFNQRSETHTELFERFVNKPGSFINTIKVMPFMVGFAQHEIETMLANAEVKQLMNEEQFDVVIFEGFFNDAMIGLGQHFNCPVIEFTSIKATDVFLQKYGNPYGLSYSANIIAEFRGPLDFKHRVYNMLFFIIQLPFMSYFSSTHEQQYNKLFPQPKYLPYKDAVKNISAIIVTQHFTEIDIKPLFPYIIEIGGVHLKDEVNPLPNDLQKWMDESTNGVVFMSLGSNAKCRNLPQEKLNDILGVFQRLKENVLWKCETDQLGDVPPNVKISKWLSQTDLLQHKNLKLFITHGGLGSVTEAKFYAIPLIIIPMFADQMVNGFNVEAAKWGKRIPYNELTSDRLYNSIREIIDSPVYRDEAKYQSMLYRDRPMSPLETGIFWTEYVIRHHGAKHMQPNSRHLNFFQLHSLDVIGFLVLILLVTLYVDYRIIKFVFKICVSKLKKHKTD